MKLGRTLLLAHRATSWRMASQSRDKVPDVAGPGPLEQVGGNEWVQRGEN